MIQKLMKLFGYVPMNREAMLEKHRHENWIRYRDANHRVLELQKENADLRAKIEELDTAARKFRELLLKAEAKIAELEKQTIWDTSQYFVIRHHNSQRRK